MPFQSEKQKRYLWMKKPAVARDFAEHGKDSKRLVIPKDMIGKGPVTIAPIGGASGPGSKTPPMPDFQSLYAQPESRKRADQEASYTDARRRSNWRDYNFDGLHGSPAPLKPVLRYVEGETSIADAAVDQKHHLTEKQIREHKDRLAAGLDYGDVNGKVKRKK